MEFPGDLASLSNSTIPEPPLALLRRETVVWFHFFIGVTSQKGCFVSHKTQCSALVTSASHHSLSAASCTLDCGCTPAQGRHETGGLLSLFFVPFPPTFQWQTACKSDLRVFSWGLHSAKIRKNGAGKQWSLHAPSKTEVEIFRGVRTPPVPLTSYAPVCVRVRVCAYARTRARVCVCVCVCVRRILVQASKLPRNPWAQTLFFVKFLCFSSPTCRKSKEERIRHRRLSMKATHLNNETRSTDITSDAYARILCYFAGILYLSFQIWGFCLRVSLFRVLLHVQNEEKTKCPRCRAANSWNRFFQAPQGDSGQLTHGRLCSSLSHRWKR